MTVVAMGHGHDQTPAVRLSWLERWAAKRSPSTKHDPDAFEAEATEAFRAYVATTPADPVPEYLGRWLERDDRKGGAS